VFDTAPDLRVIGRWGVGHDAIDVAAATRHGVAVCTAVGGNHEAVADYAVALMCALQRGLLQNHRLITAGRWRTEFRRSLWRATVGIVGLGRIGQAVARRCRGFDMRILACEPYPDRAFVEAHGIELVSLEDLLRQADLVTLHCPATPENHHLIDRQRLALMKPTAYLVNTARGALVDESALHEALATRRIAGAGLDVFEKEPLFDSPLFSLDNVILSPHLAGVDETSEVAMADRAIDAILAVWRGEAPARECLVNPEVLGRR
jgi:D-3-phosphoglycerate dehydrogenase